MATSEGIPSSIDIEFLELNDNPYFTIFDGANKKYKKLYSYELALYINNNDIEYAKLHEKIIVIFLQE